LSFIYEEHILLEQELFVLYLLAIGCGGCEAEQRKNPPTRVSLLLIDIM
jgi:hypothetical protein